MIQCTHGYQDESEIKMILDKIQIKSQIFTGIFTLKTHINTRNIKQNTHLMRNNHQKRILTHETPPRQPNLE